MVLSISGNPGNASGLRSAKYVLPVLICLAINSHPSRAEVSSGAVTGGEAADDGGVFQLIPAPATLPNNPYNDNDVRSFDEMQDLVLTSNLIMDAEAAGLSSNVLGAGSVVSSHYVIFDPDSLKTVIGSVTFDEPILGIITSDLRFNSSDDLLGNPGTSYTIGSQALEDTDTVSISGSTIDFEVKANSPGDAIRVITGIDPVPGINVCASGTETLSGIITGGAALDKGGEFKQICDPVGSVGDNNFDSFDLFAFEEQQAVELDADLFLDDTTVIAAGEVVSSFYVVWDPIPTNRVLATVTFPDDVIGVIADRTQLEDSEFLGNASANYLNPNLLGLESGDDFTIDGDQIMINFSAGSPGDSIRVILGSASPNLSYNICEPADMTLSGTLTAGSAAAAGGTFSQLCEPIGPVGNNNLQSNDLFAFTEAQGAVLAEPLDLDLPEGSSLPAGTLVSSYYIAFDPSNDKNVVGSVTFPGDILGIATSITNLNASDNLGNPTATYLNPNLRGLEANDFASFSGDTLSVDFDANSPGDYVRVFVGEPDADVDGVADISDNCILAANGNQRDTDGDGIGNACDADFNNDCVVNFLDLGQIKSAFFSADPDTDLNGDGVVNFLDLGLVKEAFFGAPGPAADPNICSVPD